MNSRIPVALLLATGAMSSLATGQSSTISNAPGIADSPTAPTAPVAARSVPITTGPNQFVYTAQLPAAEELTRVAAAKGTTVTRVVQTTSEITTTYQLRNGQTHVVAYRLLPNTAQIPSTSAPLIVTTPLPRPVVYVPRPPRVVYYDSYGWYDPWFWSPRLSVHLSFGHGHHYRYGGFFHHAFHRHVGFPHHGFTHRSHFRHR